MNLDNPREITLDHLESENPYEINNFIASDPSRPAAPPEFSLDENTFIFDGIMLGLCIKGSCTIRIDYREFDLEENTIITILPNHIFEVKNRSENLLQESIFFSHDFMTGLPIPNDFDIFYNMGANPCIKVPEEVMRNLISYHAFILKQCHSERPCYRTPIIRGLLYSLILEIGAIYQKYYPYEMEKDTSRKEEIIKKFFDLLKKHYKQERSVSFYADKIFVTTKHLSLVIKNVTGKPALKWIEEMIMTDIKTKLKLSKDTVLQISEELNFSSPSLFCRFFKQHTGVTPLEYRQRL